MRCPPPPLNDATAYNILYFNMYNDLWGVVTKTDTFKSETVLNQILVSTYIFYTEYYNNNYLMRSDVWNFLTHTIVS